MSRTLILLRHGKSDWSTGEDDFDRPLKKRGRRAAALVGKWLGSTDQVPDFVVSSPAKRAMQTAEIACEAMTPRHTRIYKRKHIYLATPEELLYVLEDCPSEARRVMLVGHNPGLEELLYFLIDGQMKIPDDGKIMPTATLAVLAMPENWAPLKNGSARLETLIRPRELH